MFKFNMSGFDELEKRLGQMERGAKELENTKSVSFDELFTDTFMKKHTQFDNLQAFFKDSNFTIGSQEDFENIPTAELDKHVANSTNFNNWQEMIDAAGTDYAYRKLGF